MRHPAILALGASALAVAACVPPGQGPGYGPTHSSVAYNPAYDDHDNGRPPLRLGDDDGRARYADREHWDGNGPPPPWVTAGNGNGTYRGDDDHNGSGPPPWTMARSGAGMGDDHHDGPPPPWTGNGQGQDNGHGYGSGTPGYDGRTHTMPGGPPDQHGYCGPVFFPGCVPRG